MTIERMDHVGIVVNDLAGAMAFFTELGLELDGEAHVEGSWVDRVIGLEGVRAGIAMMRTPGGQGRVELSTFQEPAAVSGDSSAPANALGIRHVSFAVKGIDTVLQRVQAKGYDLIGQLEQYESTYRLCYIRGPEGIIVELAEAID
ncbi:MAG TPA: VOC family protein [Candidatus Limnocylindrales bacterium]|nr:VOC family protein [Candidatus Limnocylindrales bacterium]